MTTLLALILGSALTAQADLKTWLDGRAQGFSGVALIARGDTVLASVGDGRRYNVGSINKTFTAIAIAQLIQQGRLSLDDTLAKHLPDYPNRDAAAKMTIRDLVTHRSGAAQFMGGNFGGGTVEQMANRVGSEPQAFAPGTSQQYSNGGYVVLGRLVEVVSHQSYADYLAEHVYRPAGVTPPSPAGIPAGGGFFTTTDLFRFARALRTGKLLDARMTDYVMNGTFAGDPAKKFGFALREQVVGGRRFIGNGGGAPGINAEFRFEPAGDYTIVVLANTSPPAATQLLGDILAHLSGATPAAAPAQPTPTPTQSPLRTEIEALHTAMIAAFKDNPADVAKFYTADARIQGGGRVFTGEGIAAYWGQVPRGASWKLEILDAGGSPDEPWLLGHSTLSRKGGAEMTTEYLAVLRRGADGKLRYRLDLFTMAAR